ncbi:MAG: hypothetical protein V3V98_06815, partial [Thermoplasmata archaeon]
MEETSFGGPGVLRDFLERIKDSEITGTLRVSAMRENVQSIGSIVFKGGHCALALHDYFGPLYSGEALKEIMRDSIKDESIIELHSYDYKSSTISIGHIKESHPSAVINELPDMEALERTVSEERHQQELRKIEARTAEEGIETLAREKERELMKGQVALVHELEK